MIEFFKNELNCSNVPKQVIDFYNKYDGKRLTINEIFSKEKIKQEIQNKTIKKCDAHLTAFIIYKVYSSILFEYDREIDEEKVTKEVTNILKDGLLN